jgi:signal transduction histidine kinase
LTRGSGPPASTVGMTTLPHHLGLDAQPLDRARLLVLAALGLVLSGAAVAVALTGSAPGEVLFALNLGLAVAVPVAVGLYVWRQPVHARIGRLLAIVGLAWFVPALAASDNELLYSVGRVAGWVLAVGLILLVLSFPAGRLPGTVDRALVGISAAVVATLYVPTALLVEQFPLPSQFTACNAACPHNAFMLLAQQPAWVDGVVVPVREVLTVATFLAVSARLAYRIAHATPLMRRTLTPVLAAAIVSTVAIAASVATRRADPGSATIASLIVVLDAGLPLVALGFLLGTFRWRLHVAGAVERLALDLRADPRPGRLRDVVARALGDPSIELAFWNTRGASRWVDGEGAPVPPPAARPGRSWTEIRDGQGHLATIVHDPALDGQWDFVGAVGTYALVGYENRRLVADVDRSLREVASSRARIQAAADDERRRIERDLHDGAQQRLVALGIRLELAIELMDEDPARARAMLAELGAEVTGTLDDVRSLATHVYPAVLADLGLADALRAVALRCPVPATVRVVGSGSHPRELEAAVYFCCLEALQNAAKHAPHSTVVTVALDVRSDLRFEVRDDGPGFTPNGNGNGAGHGLLNMRDRIEAVGGRLEVSTAPGRGTRITGIVPSA